jgi:hypothetical protein
MGLCHADTLLTRRQYLCGTSACQSHRTCVYTASTSPHKRVCHTDLPITTTSLTTELVLDGMDPEWVAGLADDEECRDVETDPYNIDTCMRGSDLPLLLDACPKLQRLTLNSVLPLWCAELYPFLLDAQVRCMHVVFVVCWTSNALCCCFSKLGAGTTLCGGDHQHKFCTCAPWAVHHVVCTGPHAAAGIRVPGKALQVAVHATHMFTLPWHSATLDVGPTSACHAALLL